jgi:hypothetical protein
VPGAGGVGHLILGLDRTEAHSIEISAILRVVIIATFMPVRESTPPASKPARPVAEDRCFETSGVPGQLWVDPAGDQGLGCWALEVTGSAAGPMTAAEFAFCRNPMRWKPCHEAQTAAEKARQQCSLSGG